MEFRWESRYAHRLLAARYPKFAPAEPSRRTTVLAVAAAVASLICEDVCVWTVGALVARSAARPVLSASAWLYVGISPATSVSYTGSADTLPVCRRNFLVVVVLPENHKKLRNLADIGGQRKARAVKNFGA
jgi:hypothetical protein